MTDGLGGIFASSRMPDEEYEQPEALDLVTMPYRILCNRELWKGSQLGLSLTYAGFTP